MGKLQISQCISVLVLFIAVVLCISPALAADSQVSIAYRGAGGNYIGDTIIFDGYNKVGNTTVLKLTGPGLPAGGVPVYDLNGEEGTGNPVQALDTDGSWRFVWYTSSIKGIDKMQTARYYITALDLKDPTQTATTSIMMKKPDFYVVATPNPLETGDYLQLVGTAEAGNDDIRIQVTDADGKVLHVYNTAASSSGYFTYAFHVDMQPGEYYVTISSPSVKTTYRTIVTVAVPVTPTPSANVTGPATTPSGIQPGQSPQIPQGPVGTLSVSSNPTGATVIVDSVPMGTTPISLASITEGSHLVEIKAPGYLTYSVQAVVKEGQITSLSPTLVKSPVSQPLSLVTVIAGLLVAGLVFLTISSRRNKQ